MNNTAYLCDAIRTPIGRYGGVLSSIRADDLAAKPIQSLISRHPQIDWHQVDDLIYGCANQAGEDNRNIARMATLLAGLPVDVPATTINRLCGSGMDAVSIAARAINSGQSQLIIAGGVESMSRAPFVIGKAKAPFDRSAKIYDTTMGWRFVNKLIQEQYGIDSMPETAENVAQQFNISRQNQDAFAYNSQRKTEQARQNGLFNDEIDAVTIPQHKSSPIIVDQDEHPRADTSIEKLATLATPFRPQGCITAGNASGINDGACALLLASETATNIYGLTPLAKVVATTCVGVAPRIMGIAPASAIEKLLLMTGLTLEQIGIIEINEAFAAQCLAVMRMLNLNDDCLRVNPNGGAIALGHPLGMSGARLVTTAMYQLQRSGERYAICAMCIGVGQGIAMLLEKI